ncbi:MAG: PEP-CTERM sorting domain-containing protein [Planctomycetota bacterium]
MNGIPITSPIPEPSTWILLGVGLVCITVIAMRKRRYLIARSNNILIIILSVDLSDR